jgi:hypothetical protein
VLPEQVCIRSFITGEIFPTLSLSDHHVLVRLEKSVVNARRYMSFLKKRGTGGWSPSRAKTAAAQCRNGAAVSNSIHILFQDQRRLASNSFGHAEKNVTMPSR